MSSEERIVEAVCAVLRGAQLKARDIVTRLGETGIETDRSELNRILYRALRTCAALRVTDDGVWSYEEEGGTTSRRRRAADRAMERTSNQCDAASSVLHPESLLDFTPDHEQQTVIEKP